MPVWNASLTVSEEDTIQSRTSAVLRGEDPVLKLLDNRMRGVFRSMMLWTPQSSNTDDGTTNSGNDNGWGVLVRLRTGRALTLPTTTGPWGGAALVDATYGTMFERAAKREFVMKGFAFCVVELVEANLITNRVINLVLDLYGGGILDPLLLDECTFD